MVLKSIQESQIRYLMLESRIMDETENVPTNFGHMVYLSLALQ